MASRAGNHTELLTLPRGGQGAGRRAPNGGIPAPVVGETVSLMRWCPVCGDEMTPEFGSSCEDPIAWACRACGFLQLGTGGRPLRGEQVAAGRELAPPAGAAPPGGRGGTPRQADRDPLLLNRDYPFRSTAEWRWVLAEELAHAVLGHTALAASDAPGGAPALREPERRRGGRGGGTGGAAGRSGRRRRSPPNF